MDEVYGEQRRHNAPSGERKGGAGEWGPTLTQRWGMVPTWAKPSIPTVPRMIIKVPIHKQ